MDHQVNLKERDKRRRLITPKHLQIGRSKTSNSTSHITKTYTALINSLVTVSDPRTKPKASMDIGWRNSFQTKEMAKTMNNGSKICREINFKLL